MKRTPEEIEAQINWATGGIVEGTRYPGMSYEEGVSTALRWVTGETDDRPDGEE